MDHLKEIRAALAAVGPVEFVNGWATAGVELERDGLRGVGIADLAVGRSRTIQIGLPESAAREMAEVSSRSPWRRLVGRGLRMTVLRAGSAPWESVDDGECLLVRRPPAGPWRDMTRPVYGDGPRRRALNDPLWHADLLRAEPAAVSQLHVEAVDGTAVVSATLDVARLGMLVPAGIDAPQLELRVERPADATFPVRIGVWLTGAELWSVLELTGPAPRPEPDPWLTWKRLTVVDMG